jgi:glycosyltransferase involved in cell wall biosynthesis
MTISACVPIYNTEPRYLEALMDSILSQSCGAHEVVLCDDCSTVDYAPVMRQWRGDSRIRYVRNPSNRGMVGNWNTAVRHSTGDLVVVLGHDDMIAPGMFAAYAAAFAKAPDIVLVSSGSQFIDDRGEPTGIRMNVNHRSNIFIDRSEYVLSGRDVAYLCLRNGSAIGELSVQMFRRSIFDRVGGFDPAFRHGADVDLAVRIAHHGRTIYLNQPYLRRRLHKNNLTWTNLSAGHVSRDRALRFEHHKRSYSFGPEELARFRAYLTACAIYDLARLPRHKSARVVGEAFRQIARYSGVHPSAYMSLTRELVTGRNRDRR